MTIKNISGSVDLVTYSGPDGHYTFQPSPEMLLADKYQVSWKSTGTETGLLLSWTCNEVAGPPGNQPLCGFDIGGVSPLAPLSYEPLDLPITFTWETRGLPGEGYRLVFIDDEDGKKIDLNMDMTAAGSYTLTTLPAQLLHDHRYHWGLTVHGSNGNGEAGEYGLVKFR
jgi:hypothetical protein